MKIETFDDGAGGNFKLQQFTMRDESKHLSHIYGTSHKNMGHGITKVISIPPLGSRAAVE